MRSHELEVRTETYQEKIKNQVPSLLGIVTGTRNPRVNAMGMSRVRVRVQTFVPTENPYPWHGYDGFDPNLNPALNAINVFRCCHLSPSTTLENERPRREWQGLG